MQHAQCLDTDMSSDIRTRRIWSYIRGGTEHKELTDRLAGIHHLENQESLGSAPDGSMTLSLTCNAPAFTSEKSLRCDIRKTSLPCTLSHTENDRQNTSWRPSMVVLNVLTSSYCVIILLSYLSHSMNHDITFHSIGV